MLSIDLFRGVVMFLLIGGVTGLYDLLVVPSLERQFIHAIGLQFHHSPWNGLRLWDLGQPFFLFISGAAMVFSYSRRWKKSEIWKATLGHALRRSFLLFVFGWALYHISPGEDRSLGVFFSDILPQLAVASLVGFILLKRPVHVQLGCAVGVVTLIYLFALSGGGDWVRTIVSPFTMSFAVWIGNWPAQALTSLAAWGMMWGLCWWLYKRKISIRV